MQSRARKDSRNSHEVVDEDGGHHDQETREAIVSEVVCMRTPEECPTVISVK